MIAIGNIYAGKSVPAVVTGADNGLALNAGIAELGGSLIQNTTIVSNGKTFALTSVAPGGTDSIKIADALGILLQAFGSAANISFDLTLGTGGIAMVANTPGGICQILFNFAGTMKVTDTAGLLGLQNVADYSTNIIANQNALTTTKAVGLLIASQGVIYALVTGQVFSGAISATNLSGTNTGDQNLAPYALIAGQVFTGAISATNLSGTNTGDQNLTPYSLIANTPQIVSSAKLAAVSATVNLLVYNVPAANAMYRVSIYLSQTAFTSGLISVNVIYTNFAGTAETILLTSSNAVQDVGVQVRSINAKASTTITIAITVTGTGTANIGGCLEFMF